MDFVGGDDLSQSSRPLGKTILEDDVFGKGNSGDGQQQGFNHTRVENTATLAQCPKCGYPLRPGVDKCPNCKFQISSSHQADQNPSAPQDRGDSGREDSYQRPTRMTSGSGKANFRGTINPYMMSMEVEPTFVLKPIKRVDERHGFEELEYEGKQVVLNRENTEQNNASITSRQQAVITNSDGHWYIEDKSEQKTTFVQAAQKIELHDGDIILLGNRLFEFHK